MKPSEVIVGVDGSAPARSALRWAAAEAARRDVRLRVLHAYQARWIDEAYLPVEVERAAREAGAALVATAVQEARGYATGIIVTGTELPGSGAYALLDAAGPDDLIVVGSRGHAGFAAALLGATSQHVATHATGPVAVVRGRADTAAGPVAVGFDGSPSAERVLGAAFAAAVTRGCGVTVVRAFRPGTPAWPSPVPPPPLFNAATVRAALDQELAKTLEPWITKYPTVAVDRVVAGGDAAHVLVDVSRGAQLVVVGSRGHGGFTGLLLGSVGLHLVHHADCPVLIVR